MSSPIAEAQVFLAPVLDRNQLLSLRNASLIQRLSIHLPSPSPLPEDTKALTSAVLTHALQLLKTIHTSSVPTSSHPDPNKLVNATEARTIVCLLDLLVLEGIYPSLSTGVGIPLERRARNFVLPATRKRVVEVENNRDIEIFKNIIDGLLQVLESADGGGVGKTIRERCLVDVLAGCGELAFGLDGTEAWKVKWEKLVDSTPTPLLLPQLLSLLHPSTPPSFRVPLTRTLSALPITRPNAIRHILELFLSTVSDSALSVDALSNASRIIGSIPTSIEASEYFSKVCPQLLDLLDGKDPGLARAAGFVIAELLGRRGPIEKVVEKEIVDAITSGLNPTPEKDTRQKPAIVSSDKRKASSALLAFEDTPSPRKNSLIQEITEHSSLISTLPDSPQDAPLVPEEKLTSTLHRISLLLSSHPSPSVPQRLLPPILLPLWALLSYTKQTSRSSWHERTLSLLKTHIKTTPTTGDESVLSALHHNILFTGDNWEFGPGSSGGIEIRLCTSTKGLDMSAIESRVEEFLSLLSDGGVAEGALNEFFLSVLRTWLQRRNGEGEDPVVMFTTLKVLQEMIARHEGALAKSPTQTLQIVKGVLDEYIDWKESLKKAEEEVAGMGPSLGGLGKIVSGVAPGIAPKRKEGRKFIGEEDEDEEKDEETERVETVTMALSLLSVLISSPGTKLTPADERLIQTLQPPLSYISTSPNMHPDLSSLAINISSLLSLHEPATTTSTSSLTEQQKESYILALSYLRDPLVPVRAHGLHLLRELILATSPVVDIPSTMRLLIGMLKDADSFVYLNVVKCLTALTDKHSKTVTRMLVDAYIDDTADTERLGLDERLRIGEALLSTVQRLGGALVGDTAAAIGEGMVGIVSRRRKREGGKSGEEWGSDPEDEEVDDVVKEKRRLESAHKARIVRGWQVSGQTEDLRIRTSALSILGAAIETNAQGLGQRVLTEAIDTSLSILTLETAVEKAILRRAAVVCIGSILKSLVGLNDDSTDDEGRWRVGVWEVVRARVGEIRRVLGYVRGADNDGLVREQSGVVGENLEAVVERWMLGQGQGGGEGRIVDIGDGNFEGLRVL